LVGAAGFEPTTDDPAATNKMARLNAAQTFEKLVQEFLQALRPRYRPASFSEIERNLTKYAKDLNKKPVAKITRQRVIGAIGCINKSPAD
jgi:glutamyl-tRNA reductase